MQMDTQHASWMARCVGRGELAPFSDTDIAELERVIGVRRAEAGSPLLDEGSDADHIGIITDGEVELTHRRKGRRAVLQVLHPGDVYGDIPLLCGLPTPFGARAASDVHVIELDAPRFWALLEQRPHVCRRVLFSVASRLERMQRRLLTVTAGDLTHQVSALLIDEAGTEGGVVPFSQTTMAELLGATRPSVNRVLKALETAGHLRLSYRRIEVLDPEGLQRALR
ncbi:MAG: Crp/Fnr family transcriptional regulator [Nitriliruptoraceae bacterium]